MTRQVRVHVKAGSSKGPLVDEAPEGALVVYVRERAVEGAANEAVVRLVATHFGVAPSCVTIRRGHTSKRKTLEVVLWTRRRSLGASNGLPWCGRVISRSGFG